MAKKEEKQEVNRKVLVVNEYPKEDLYEVEGKDNTVYDLVLPTDALTEILQKVREIHSRTV